ncbi:uncharacterized protein LOC112520651 isoform X5 [Cynara cardunculus var. scolymus]|uniref:uncharacterized protein LOC112520651 isoform X5 n=1 Tax=Cynara cardunculus var. scolymus TaxID=59895 RepID=UPI000D6230A7|nr:uncharacterized protein LOC112520651 isoform X5 [Cynara cardunculus var. scolymus]
MASSVFVKQWLLAMMLLFIVLFCFKSGKAETGIAGTGIGYIPEPGGGARDSGGDEPEEVIVKALECFSDKHIYSSCEESYRLTERGQLNVPPEFADEYCNGPCLKETHLVLNCINDILTHFVFYNHATIKDVKETIKVGCGYGPHRGDFNVAEHIESNSYQHLHPILFGVTSLILLCSLLLF